MGKTNRHKRRMEDSEDLFDRRAKNRRQGSSRKHSNPSERNANGRTRTGLYRLFIPAYESLEGFFDKYGYPVIDDPENTIEGIDDEYVYTGAKTFLKNERDSLKNDASELNEVIRQFPFTEDEAFRDSIEGSIFNVGQIYEQIEHNDELFPNPVVQGNFVWNVGTSSWDSV